MIVLASTCYQCNVFKFIPKCLFQSFKRDVMVLHERVVYFEGLEKGTVLQQL